MSQQSLKKNTAYNFAKSVASIVFPLISFPYASRMLLPEGMGKVSFSSSVVAYFSLLASLGMTVYAIRECAKVRDDRERLEALGSQLFTISLCTTFLSYALMMVVLLLPTQVAEYRVLIIVLSGTIVAATLGADWVNSAMEDFRFIAIRTIAFQLISLVLLFLLVKGPEDYYAYAGITLFSSAGANVANILYRRRYCRLRVTPRPGFRRHMPPILTLFGLQLAQIVYVNSDLTMLGLMKGDFETGLYSLTVKVYNMVNVLVASVATVVMPRLANAYARGDYEEINGHLAYALNFILSLGLPCIIAMDVMAPEVVLFFGGESFQGAERSLMLLSAALLFSYLGGFVANVMFIPSGRERACLWAAIAAAVVNVVLNLVLIPRFGYIAAAGSTVAAELVSFLVLLPRVEKEVSLAGMRTNVPGIVAGCLCVLALTCVARLLPFPAIAKLAIAAALGAAALGAALVVSGNELGVAIAGQMRNIAKRGRL